MSTEPIESQQGGRHAYKKRSANQAENAARPTERIPATSYTTATTSAAPNAAGTARTTTRVIACAIRTTTIHPCWPHASVHGQTLPAATDARRRPDPCSRCNSAMTHDQPSERSNLMTTGTHVVTATLCPIHYGPDRTASQIGSRTHRSTAALERSRFQPNAHGFDNHTRHAADWALRASSPRSTAAIHPSGSNAAPIGTSNSLNWSSNTPIVRARPARVGATSEAGNPRTRLLASAPTRTCAVCTSRRRSAMRATGRGGCAILSISALNRWFIVASARTASSNCRRRWVRASHVTVERIVSAAAIRPAIQPSSPTSSSMRGSSHASVRTSGEMR